MVVLCVYLVFMTFEIPLLFKTILRLESAEISSNNPNKIHQFAGTESPVTFSIGSFQQAHEQRMKLFKKVSGLVLDQSAIGSINKNEFSELHKMARDAIVAGKNLWGDIVSGKVKIELENKKENYSESCPNSVSLSGDEFVERGRVIVIPCGLALGSHITIVGKPYWAHSEKNPKIRLVKDKEESVMVSQFMMELQGLKAVDGEDTPKILHFNPRLKGDWSGRPVIEQNTCYRTQWGSALRCEGWKSNADEETGERLFIF